MWHPFPVYHSEETTRKQNKNIKSKCNKMSAFQDLPDELVLKILRNSETKDLISCGQVSKRIRKISRDGTLWVCFSRNCNKEVTHAVGKNCLQRLKKLITRKLNTDWEKINKASSNSKFPVCNKHNNIQKWLRDL